MGVSLITDLRYFLFVFEFKVCTRNKLHIKVEHWKDSYIIRDLDTLSVLIYSECTYILSVTYTR